MGVGNRLGVERWSENMDPVWYRHANRERAWTDHNSSVFSTQSPVRNSDFVLNEHTPRAVVRLSALVCAPLV